MKKKGMVKKIICVGMVVMIFCMMSSCVFKKVDGDVEYVIYKNNQYKDDGLYIISLSESKLAREVLEVPAFIKNTQVDFIGIDNGFMGSTGIKSDNLKKLYIPYTLKGWRGGQESLRCKNLEKLVNFKAEMINSSYSYFDNIKVYAPKIVVEEFNNDKMSIDNKWVIYAANLSYFFNYEGSPNKDYFRVDFLENEEVLPNVPEPEREGYKFKGWYKDAACLEEFKAEGAVMQTEEIELYAGWEKKVEKGRGCSR